MTVHVQEVKEPGPEWFHYLEQDSSSCSSHDPRWGRIFHDVFGHHPIYLQAEKSSEIRGVLPLVMISSWMFGRFVVSMPCLNHGGICAGSLEARNALLEKAIDLTKSFKASWMELRHETSTDWPLAVRQHKVAMQLPLPQDPDCLFRSFPAKLRSQIRRAEKEGMSVRSGGVEEVKAFYRVFSQNMRDLGTPVYPKRFFEKLMETFSETARIFTIYDGSSPVASGLVMACKNRLEIPWASSLRQYNRFGVNMLLYWSVIESACKERYRVFDFGRSTPHSGTYRFKKQWGAEPVPLYWYYWMKNGRVPPEMNPQNPKYRFAINVWRRLPIALTRLIGPSIVKNLP